MAWRALDEVVTEGKKAWGGSQSHLGLIWGGNYSGSMMPRQSPAQSHIVELLKVGRYCIPYSPPGGHQDSQAPQSRSPAGAFAHIVS